MRSNRPYVQLDPAVIEQARQMDLLTYLQHYEPSNLRRVAGNVYCTALPIWSAPVTAWTPEVLILTDSRKSMPKWKRRTLRASLVLCVMF